MDFLQTFLPGFGVTDVLSWIFYPGCLVVNLFLWMTENFQQQKIHHQNPWQKIHNRKSMTENPNRKSRKTIHDKNPQQKIHDRKLVTEIHDRKIDKSITKNT